MAGTSSLIAPGAEQLKFFDDSRPLEINALETEVRDISRETMFAYLTWVAAAIYSIPKRSYHRRHY